MKTSIWGTIENNITFTNTNVDVVWGGLVFPHASKEWLAHSIVKEFWTILIALVLSL